MIKVLYFAGLKELTKRSDELIDGEGLTVKELKHVIKEKYESFDDTGVRVAINEEFVQNDEQIQTGDVIAFIPPVSGG